MIEIDKKRCNGIDNCPANGVCIEICALNCLSVDNERQIQVNDECPSCGLCIMNCPNEAIHKTDDVL